MGLGEEVWACAWGHPAELKLVAQAQARHYIILQKKRLPLKSKQAAIGVTRGSVESKSNESPGRVAKTAVPAHDTAHTRGAPHVVRTEKAAFLLRSSPHPAQKYR